MNSCLLDTHTLIWFLEGDLSLSQQVKRLIENKANINFVSIASLWEIAIKVGLKKLETNSSLDKIFELIQDNGFNILPISQKDILTVASLPFFHKDPFDRLIIAQAISNQMVLLSKDENFKFYDAKVVW